MERYAVIGLGRYGSRLAQLLTNAGADVVAIDQEKGLVESLRDRVSLAVCMDSTDEDALLAQGIDKVDVAMVCIGADFEANALTTVILKQLGIPRVISRATTNTRGQILSRIGADDIANPEKESAERWRDRLLVPALMERTILAEGYSLAQVQAPSSFYGKTLKELGVASKYKVLVVAIRRSVAKPGEEDTNRSGHPSISIPGPDTTIEEGDILVLIGSDDALKAFPT